MVKAWDGPRSEEATPGVREGSDVAGYLQLPAAALNLNVTCAERESVPLDVFEEILGDCSTGALIQAQRFRQQQQPLLPSRPLNARNTKYKQHIRIDLVPHARHRLQNSSCGFTRKFCTHTALTTSLDFPPECSGQDDHTSDGEYTFH